MQALVGSAALAVAAAGGSALVNGESAGAATTGSPYQLSIYFSGRAMPGDLGGSTYLVNSYSWSLTPVTTHTGAGTQTSVAVGDLVLNRPTGGGSTFLVKDMRDASILSLKLVVGGTGSTFVRTLSSCTVTSVVQAGDGSDTEQVKLHCGSALLQSDSGGVKSEVAVP